MTDETGIEALETVSKLLSSILRERKEQCVLETGGARDETMLLGTGVGLLRLAEVLVHLVLGSKKGILEGDEAYEDKVAGEDVWVTNEIKGILSEEGDVWVVAACLVRDASALERIRRKLEANRSEE